MEASFTGVRSRPALRLLCWWRSVLPMLSWLLLVTLLSRSIWSLSISRIILAILTLLWWSMVALIGRTLLPWLLPHFLLIPIVLHGGLTISLIIAAILILLLLSAILILILSAISALRRRSLLLLAIVLAPRGLICTI